MIQKNTLVLYKKSCAIVTDFDGEKIVIRFQASDKKSFQTQKVREKDIVLLSKTPASSLEVALEWKDEKIADSIKEAAELLESDEETKNSPISFFDLCDIIKPDAKADEAWFLYDSLIKSLEFSLESISSAGVSSDDQRPIFVLRNQDEMDAIKQKQYEKEHEAELHDAFMARLKKLKIDLPNDAKYMAEIENVALGKTEKSKIMAELNISQTPEKAHKLLLQTHFWDITRNPYPTRFNLSMNSAHLELGEMPKEERLEVSGTSFAIDAEWSPDPDDAVQFDGKYFWVHIADPASFVMPDSPIDKMASNRGSTLYIPEGAFRMLSETCLSDYALGLKEKSFALSFRLLLNEDASIVECKVFKTIINVKRLTYKEATEKKESPELKPLFEMARKNTARRKKAGANEINMGEVHINIEKETKKVEIFPIEHFEADDMVKEMMLLAGEGAAHFAYENKIPFPYISQESPLIPEKLADGLAGQFQLLKCMKKRNVGVTPAMHCSLGLAFYSQVTSPLRRYADLIAHEQLRAFLDGRRLIDKDAMMMKISAGDVATVACKKASRLSETHWKLIYLLQNPDWMGEAICIENRGPETVLFVPTLAMQTIIKGQKLKLNEKITVKASNIDIPTQKVDFVRVG